MLSSRSMIVCKRADRVIELYRSKGKGGHGTKSKEQKRFGGPAQYVAIGDNTAS